MKREIMGRVMRALVGRDATSLVTTHETEIRVTIEGVEGDKHAGITRLSDSRTPWYTRGTTIRNSRQALSSRWKISTGWRQRWNCR